MRMRASLLFAFLLGAAVLAGCAGKGPAQDASDVPTPSVTGVKSTADTGIILGVVVDPAIQPVPGANVTVNVPGHSPMAATTGQDGGFGFQGLSPGEYFVSAHKA